MRPDLKTLLLAALLAAFAFGGYWLGRRDSLPSAPSPAAPSTVSQGSGRVHPPLPAAEPAPRFHHFRVGNRNVKALLADGDVVWVGTSGGVIRYHIGEDDYQLYNIDSGSLLSNGVFHLAKLGDRLLVGTYGGGLSVYEPATDRWRNYNIPDGLADQFVYDTALDQQGDLWIATWSGVNRVRGARLDDPEAWETFDVENTAGGLPNDWVYGVEVAPDGSVWLATEGGVARYRDGRWRHWNHQDGVGAPFEEVKDSIQFKSDPGAASRHHARQKHEQGLERVNVAYNPNYIVSLVVDGDGVVWAGTWGGGLARFDGQRWTNYTTRDGLPANHVFMLYLDTDGTLWIGTSAGLARFRADGEGFVTLTRADGLYADNVFSLSRAADGSLWVGSYGGVARLHLP